MRWTVGGRGAWMVAATLMAAAPVQAATPALRPERTVVVMRHGVRAPLDGEVPADTRTARPWPRWPVAPGLLTAHGAAALALVARHDRRWLLPGLRGCPAPGTVRIWTNSTARTIASGEAYAAALAPGCALPVGHLAADAADPLFEPLRAHADPFDPAAAIRSIDRATGGMAALAQRHRAAIRALDGVLDCAGGSCSPAGGAAVTPSADGAGIDLAGPIRRTSGIAQALLLQWAEGMPARDVGWGRADARMVERLGALHAALFAVFTRPPYMAAHQAAPLARRIIADLETPDAPRLDVLVGHDTNVNALAAVLGVDLDAPGFARNDVAPGGALVIRQWRDPATGRRFVRLAYRVQPLAAIRRLSPAVTVRPLAIPGCAVPCRQDRFVALLRAHLPATAMR